MSESITPSDLHAATDAFYSALAEVLGGNAESMLDLWSHCDDVSYLGPMGELVVGWGPVRQAWVEQASNQLGGAVTPADLHFVGGDPIGVVVGWEHGSGHHGIPETIHIRATSTYRRENGSIKMIGHHTDLIG